MRVSGVILALAVLATVSACTRKLDEAMMYEGPQFRIKLVRYYEFMPLHYNGEVFRVVCASERTRHSPALKMQEAGWVRIGNGSAIGSGSAAELAARFDALRVSPAGRISFVVFTEALRDAQAVRVHSTDFGATWQATRVDGSAS